VRLGNLDRPIAAVARDDEDPIDGFRRHLGKYCADRLGLVPSGDNERDSEGSHRRE
jgi:hypothetical protein